MRMKQISGFTLIELLIVVALMSIIAAFALPGVLSWIPDYRLKGAADDLYSNMQSAKLGAVKNNTDWAIVFDSVAGVYYVCSDPGTDSDWSTMTGNTVEKTVTLANYNSGVGYGFGSATKNATTSGGAPPPDGVSYGLNRKIFNSRGTGSTGYVYIENEKNNAYAAGTRSNGFIVLKRWDGSDWK